MTTTELAQRSAPPSARQRREQFVARIMELCRDKGTQADLRSGLGLLYTRCPRMHRHLVPLVPEDMRPDARQARYTVASLIAARPRETRDADAEAATKPQQAEQEQTAAADAAEKPSGAAKTSRSVPAWRPDLGFSLAEGVRLNGLKGGSAEGELHLLTRQSLAAMVPRLPSLVRLLLRAKAPVDWALLLGDLSSWTYDRDRIATRWLENYYRTLYANDEQAPASGSGSEAADDSARRHTVRDR